MTLDNLIAPWVLNLRQRLAAGGQLEPRDLDELERLATTAPRQELLYLHAALPSIHSDVVGETHHPCRPGIEPEIEASPPPRRYRTVHQAVLDGWWIVQFPHQRLGAGALGVIGYEFILQRPAS